MRQHLLYVLCLVVMSACASAPAPVRSADGTAISTPRPDLRSPKNTALTASLPDRSFFHQQDPRWASHTLGGSGEPLKSDGCLVTSAAMALSNLGFVTDPGDLVTRLKAVGGFTSQGWMIWSGLEKVTGGIASARFYTEANEAHVKSCLSDGFYPLVKFRLPSRSTHWAVVVGDSDKGFYIRDPMVSATTPIPLSARTNGIEAVRCVGVEDV